MDSSARSSNRIFYIFLGAILFVHAALMVTKIRDQFAETTFKPSIQSIKVKLVQEALKEMALSQRTQIVQSEDADSIEKKKDAFLSDKDRSFDRQTVAKNIDTFKKAAQGDSNVTQKAQMKEAEVKKKADIKNLKLSDFGIASGDPMPKKTARAPASQSVKGMKNGDPMAQGLSATNDYVEEVTLGDFTHLNTVEYKFYGFYHRIRQKLEQFWGKSIHEKAQAIFRSGRRLPASENLITSLQVALNEKGEIISVKILGASGVKELDDAAIESFNEAGPFPNPPKELLVNGKATIDWGFVVKS
ncbi:MAG: TonB family protein [Bdellovibrionales bacterium]|nr:TonB family protein [Bdellovibrionales bacterium]